MELDALRENIMDFERNNPEGRFWCKVDVKGEDDCWLWKAAKVTNGLPYGLFRLWSGKTMQLSHRVSWMFKHGPIPYGKKILHKCNNPPCVNPKHLYLGTQHDNMQDRNYYASKKRHRP